MMFARPFVRPPPFFFNLTAVPTLWKAPLFAKDLMMFTRPFARPPPFFFNLTLGAAKDKAEAISEIVEPPFLFRFRLTPLRLRGI
jgi:hypothetical protein